MGDTKKRSISAEPVRSATTNIELPASIENSTNSIERIDYTVNKHLDSDIHPTNRSNSKQTKSKITKTNTETSKEQSEFIINHVRYPKTIIVEKQPDYPSRCYPKSPLYPFNPEKYHEP